MKHSALALIPLLFVGACSSGGGGTSGAGGGGTVIVAPSPTPSPTPAPFPSPTPTPSPTATPTPTPTPTTLSPGAPIVDASWSTFQRDPGHTGYVKASFTTASFADAWSIATPSGPSEVAARTGSVFFNDKHADGHVYTHAVSTTNGSSLWTFDIGAATYPVERRPFGPAYANNRVASMRANSTSTANGIQVINATTGAYLSTATYDAQHSSGSVVTPVGDELFFMSGYYGGVIFNANAASGDNLWRTEAAGMYGGNVQQGESVAVDQSYVYFFKAGSLVVLSRSGVILKSIQNPFFSQFGLSYFGEFVGAPILDGAGRIFTFSDNYSPGKALPIVAFSLNNDKPLWRTGYSYTGQPALRGDRIYAIRSSTAAIDVIDTATGAVGASFDVGGTGNLTSNVVVSDSHLFVASSSTTYAIDLNQSDYPVVWKTPFGGTLAITPDNYLMISTETGLRAIRLK